MEKLPVELKQIVCGFLDNKDLRTIRLLNRIWARIAALHLFESILITPLSLERLKLIAQHEYIGTCIRALAFCTDLLPSILPEMWHEEITRRHQGQIKEDDSFRFQRYVLAYREQQRLRENNYKLTREILDLSIPMFKRLQCLALVAWGVMDRGYAIDNSCDPNQRWARVWGDLEDHVLDNCAASRRETEISTQFSIMLNALEHSGLQMRKLALWRMRLGLLQRVLQPRRELYCARLSTLKIINLDLSVISRHSHDTTDGQCEVAALSTLLEEAQNLQILGLCGNISRFSRPYFLQCFRPSLPKLSTLFICGMGATEQILIDTLMPYRATLAWLGLSYFELTESNCEQSMGSWPHFFRRVPETLPCLLRFRLRYLKYTVQVSRSTVCRHDLPPPYSRAVEHAITKRTDIPDPE